MYREWLLAFYSNRIWFHLFRRKKNTNKPPKPKTKTTETKIKYNEIQIHSTELHGNNLHSSHPLSVL